MNKKDYDLGDRLIGDGTDDTFWVLFSNRNDNISNRYWAKRYVESFWDGDYDVRNMVLRKCFMEKRSDHQHHPDFDEWYSECCENTDGAIKATRVDFFD